MLGGQAFSFELALFRAQTLDFGGPVAWPKMYRGASRVCAYGCFAKDGGLPVAAFVYTPLED